MKNSEEQDAADRRPTPVRAAMDSVEPGAEDSDAPGLTFLDPEDGQEWVVRVTGRSRSGVVPLRVIPLMEVVFCSVEAPDVVVRRALCKGESADALSEEELIRLFRESGPASRAEARGSQREGRDRRKRPRRKP
jgi:hypothetical protein